MLPSFFDSVLQLIVRTSTDLPPDVRAAMRRALGAEPAGTRVGAGADDHRAEHRSGRRRRRARSARTPACRPSRSRRRSAPIRSGCGSRSARRSPRRRGAASCGRIRSIRSPARTRRQPRARHADHPLRSVGARRDRDQADSQRRRLREHERAVLRCRSNCRIWAAPIARSTASASASCTRSGRRRARAAARAPSACASAAIARRAISHAKEQLFRTLDDVNPDPRLAELEASIMGDGQHARHRHDGIRRQASR